MNIIDQVLMGMVVLIGEEGTDWNYYLSWTAYWDKWVWLNRN